MTSSTWRAMDGQAANGGLQAMLRAIVAHNRERQMAARDGSSRWRRVNSGMSRRSDPPSVFLKLLSHKGDGALATQLVTTSWWEARLQ